MNRILTIILLLFTFQQSLAQQTQTDQLDSTLYKMVRGTKQLIRARAKAINYSEMVMSGWPDRVRVQGVMGSIPVDSIGLQYRMDSIKSISIDFDIPFAIGGSQALFGDISLCKKGDMETIPEWSEYGPYVAPKKPDEASDVLYKMVRGIQALILQRARDGGYPEEKIRHLSDKVFFLATGESLSIDQLVHYDIWDFRLIYISFEPISYLKGPQSPYGFITLLRKDEIHNPALKEILNVRHVKGKEK